VTQPRISASQAQVVVRKLKPVTARIPRTVRTSEPGKTKSAVSSPGALVSPESTKSTTVVWQTPYALSPVKVKIPGSAQLTDVVTPVMLSASVNLVKLALQRR